MWPLKITARVSIPEHEVGWEAVRAQGAGGQHVNKVASAVHLRFDVNASSLPESWKVRLAALGDRRISREGIVVIKAQRQRSQEQNLADALARLRALVLQASVVPAARKATRPTRASHERRLAGKARHGKLKQLRTSRAADSE